MGSSLAYELATLIRNEGDFTLRNGKKSSVYYDVRASFGDPDFLDVLADKLWEMIGYKTTCVVGNGLGGIPLATAISTRHRVKLSMIRAKPKEHGLQKMIEGYIPTSKDRVAIVDDIFSSGSSNLEAIRIIEPTLTKIASCSTVIHREEADPAILGVPFHYLFTAREIDDAYELSRRKL